jgi:uncharacterized membrane protein YhaH (DUF805 family)
MFIGHFALGFGAKRIAPAVSLGTFFLAAQLADLLWPTFLLLGLEQVVIRPGDTAVTPLSFVSYPYSHSLIALLGWGALFAVLYAIARRGKIAAAVLLGLTVVSHWVLDVIVHRPDLPLTLHGRDRIGLGLWNSVPATLILELLLFFAGVALYARSTMPVGRTGRWSFLLLVGFLLGIYLMNLFGPPPPSVNAVAWTTQAMWLLVLWGHWIDRHRVERAS